MSERSVQCPECPFSFAKLVDAGDFHAYVCPSCGWAQTTTDRRPGNRPADVCGLCDQPLDPSTGADFHLYVGRGWVHGGGRERHPVHATCLTAGGDEDHFARRMARAWVGHRGGADIDPLKVHEELRADQLCGARGQGT